MLPYLDDDSGVGPCSVCPQPDARVPHMGLCSQRYYHIDEGRSMYPPIQDKTQQLYKHPAPTANIPSAVYTANIGGSIQDKTPQYTSVNSGVMMQNGNLNYNGDLGPKNGFGSESVTTLQPSFVVNSIKVEKGVEQVSSVHQQYSTQPTVIVIDDDDDDEEHESGGNDEHDDESDDEIIIEKVIPGNSHLQNSIKQENFPASQGYVNSIRPCDNTRISSQDHNYFRPTTSCDAMSQILDDKSAVKASTSSTYPNVSASVFIPKLQQQQQQVLEVLTSNTSTSPVAAFTLTPPPGRYPGSIRSDKDYTQSLFVDTSLQYELPDTGTSQSEPDTTAYTGVLMVVNQPPVTHNTSSQTSQQVPSEENYDPYIASRIINKTRPSSNDLPVEGLTTWPPQQPSNDLTQWEVPIVTDNINNHHQYGSHGNNEWDNNNSNNAMTMDTEPSQWVDSNASQTQYYEYPNYNVLESSQNSLSMITNCYTYTTTVATNLQHIPVNNNKSAFNHMMYDSHNNAHLGKSVGHMFGGDAGPVYYGSSPQSTVFYNPYRVDSSAMAGRGTAAKSISTSFIPPHFGSNVYAEEWLMNQ